MARAGTMRTVSSAATSLNASGSTGVGRPAKTYAAHNTKPDGRERDADEDEIAANEPGWCAVVEPASDPGGRDAGKRKDQRQHRTMTAAR